MRTLSGPCLALCVAFFAQPAVADPPPGRSPTEAPSRKAKLEARKAADAAMKQALIKGLMHRGGAMRDVLGTGGGRRASGDFRAADRAYERGDWAEAVTLYAKGDVLDREQMRFGPSRAALRYGHACQAIERRGCAVDASDALSAANRASLGGMLGGGGRGRDRGSRLSRVMRDLIGQRRRARRLLDQGKPAEADRLWGEVYREDPRCPGRDCPPFVLRDMSGVYARAGRFEAAGEALGAFLKAIPKHPERKALKRQIKTWKTQAKQAKAADAAALEANKVRIPKPKAPAPWLQTAERTPSPRFSVIRYGGDVGVARMGLGETVRWFGLRAGERIVQGLALPAKVKWVDVGGDGRIYYATAEGALFASELASAQSPFTALGAAPGADHWDAQGTTVVASSETQVWIWDKGATAPRAHTHPREIGKAWARADGIVVFGDALGASVSADGGRTWTHAALGDMRGLHRDGQRIAQRPREPMEPGFGDRTPGRCAQGELTGDLKWVVPGEQPWRRSSGWESVFSVGVHARAPAGLPTGAGVAAAKGGADAAAEIAKCRADPGAYFKRGGGAGALGGMGERCDGLGCVAAPALPATPVRFGLMGDARCATDAEAAVLVPVLPSRSGLSRWSRGPRMCAGLTRAGTLVRVTATDFDALPPIANCAPERVDSVMGVGVVSCVEADGGRALVVLDAAGVERERLAIDGRPRQISVAADGTLAMAVHGAASVAGAVRRPIALGATGAWRIDTAPGARFWRAAPGGHGIAVAPGSKAEPVFSRPMIQRRRADGTHDYRTWSSRRMDAVKACHATAFAADATLAGQLILTLDIDAGGQIASLATDNRLGGDSQPFLDCVFGILQGDTGLAGAATETIRLSLGSKNTSLRASLTAPGEPVKPLTEDVVFERPPQQISARDDGSVAVKAGGYPAKDCTLPKAGELLCPKPR